MNRVKKEYYYVVLTKSGKLLLFDAQLPIFWLKKVADKTAKSFPGCRVKRIASESLALLLNEGCVAAPDYKPKKPFDPFPMAV